MSRRVIAVVIGLFAIQVAQATTVSQVLNNLRNQNFSEQTLNSVESLLEKFVDQDDRFNGHISQKAADRNYLKQMVSHELKHSSDSEYCRAIDHVQQILNFNKQPHNTSGPMRVGEGGFQCEGLLKIVRPLLTYVPQYEASDFIQKFVNEIRKTGKYKIFSPKENVVQMLQNFATQTCSKEGIIEINFTQNGFEVLEDTIYAMTNSIDKVVKEVATFFTWYDRSLDRRLDFLHADKYKLCEELAMACIIKNIRNRFHPELIQCFLIYVLYLDLYSSRIRQFSEFDEIKPVDELLKEFEETLNFCLKYDHSHFYKDLSLNYVTSFKEFLSKENFLNKESMQENPFKKQSFNGHYYGFYDSD